MMPASQTDRSFWRLVIPPAIWAVHFMASYATVSVWCSKVASDGRAFSQVQTVIGVYSVVALAGIAFTGWIGYSECARGIATRSADTPESRHRFLGYATLLLSALSGVATVFAALATFFFRSCA
jgi:hypothetical protein